jgi:hypothetical protein
MEIQEALYAHLIADGAVFALADVRGYPVVIPQDVDLPAWAYQQISAVHTLAHGARTGSVLTRFQITCTGESYSQADELLQAIRFALNGFRGDLGGSGGVVVHEIVVEGEVDGWNLTSAKYTRRLDIRILFGSGG